MRQRNSEKWLDALFDYGLCLPLTMCDGSSSRAVRFLGVFWFFIWLFPAAVIAFLPIVLLLFADIFESTWKGREF